MRNTWLHLALCASVLGYCPTWFRWIWICASVVWLWRIQKKSVWISIALLILLQVRLQPTEQAKPKDVQIVEITDIKSGYVIAKNETQSVILYQVEDVNFQDVLEVKGTCTPLHSTQNFNLFDFSAWAKRRGIQYGCQVKKATFIKRGTSLRSKIYQNIQEMEEAPRDWLLSTLYGINNEDEQEPSFLISSSGMHLSYLAHLLQVVLTLWLPQLLAEGLSLCAIITIGSVTVMKDALQRILLFRCASFVFHKKSVHDRLGIGMLATLLLFPYMAQELSYVLPVLFRLVYLFRVKKRNQTLLSMAVLIPAQFSYFNEVNVISLFLFPYLRKVFALTYGLALLYLVVPFSYLFTIAQAILTIANTLAHLEWNVYYHANMWFLCIWFYYLFHYISSNPKYSGQILCAMLLYTQVSPYLRPYMEVVMLDVGQGDSTLISLPFNRGNILLDVAGSPYKNIPADIIVPALRAKGIRSLDAVIITHDDFDHAGGLAQLQELMDVKQVINEKQENFEIANLMFEFPLWQTTYEDINENSMVTFFEAYDLRFLFMGDVGKGVERDIIRAYPNLQADILKVGHHGSHTSSDASFVHQIHPRLALISCGYQNRYGHPSPETLTTLSNENVLALDSPTDGAISIKMTNFIRFYNTAASEFGIIKGR